MSLLLLALTSHCNWLLPLGSASLPEAGPEDLAGRDAAPARDCFPCAADADVVAAPGDDGPTDLKLEGALVKDAVQPQVDLSLYCADLANWKLTSAVRTCYADCYDPNGPLRTVACEMKDGG